MHTAIEAGYRGDPSRHGVEPFALHGAIMAAKSCAVHRTMVRGVGCSDA